MSNNSSDARPNLTWWQLPFATAGFCADCYKGDDGNDCLGLCSCEEEDAFHPPFGSTSPRIKARKDPYTMMSDYSHRRRLVAIPTCIPLREEAAFRRYLLLSGKVLSTGNGTEACNSRFHPTGPSSPFVKNFSQPIPIKPFFLNHEETVFFPERAVQSSGGIPSWPMTSAQITTFAAPSEITGEYTDVLNDQEFEGRISRTGKLFMEKEAHNDRLVLSETGLYLLGK